MAAPETFDVLRPSASDIKMMLLADVHLTTPKSEPGMRTYLYGKTEKTGDQDNQSMDRGTVCSLINLQKSWDKLVLAARVLAAVEDPKAIYCVGQRNYAQRPIIKFAQYIGATPLSGRFTPGQLTNQITKQFVEPKVMLIADPRTDSQAVKESSYVNIPVIALCGADAPLNFVDICIPCNNRQVKSLGLIFWLLAREVLRLRGTITRTAEWNVKVDLFFHKTEKDLEAQLAEEEAKKNEPYEEDMYDATYAEEPYNNMEAVAAPQENAVANEFGAAEQNWDSQGNWGQQQQGATPGQVPQQPAQQDWDAQAYGNDDWNSYDNAPQQPQANQMPAQQQQYAPAQPQQGYGAPQQAYGGGYGNNAELDDWDG